MRLGLSAPSPEDAARAVRAFQFQLTGPRHLGWRSRRVLHAHGSFGHGPVMSPSSAALRTALFMLTLGPPIDTVWVPQLDMLYGLDLGSFPFAVRELGDPSGESPPVVDAWLTLEPPAPPATGARPDEGEAPPSG